MANLTARNFTLKTADAEWWPILLGMLVMYVPTLFDLFTGLWITEGQAHGPVMLVLDRKSVV